MNSKASSGPWTAGINSNAFAIESSGPYLSVALARSGRVVFERLIKTSWNHEIIFWRHLPKWLKTARLNTSDLDLVATTQGPGRFTGIRLGLGICNTWSLAHKIPVFAPPLHELMRWQHQTQIKKTPLRETSPLPKPFCLIAFSGSTVLAKPLKNSAEAIPFASLDDLFHSKRINPGDFLIIYAAEHLIRDILERCRQGGIQAQTIIPQARGLLDRALREDFPKSFYFKPPRLAPALYLKESWK
ncbi:MAG: hypothetical protein HY547_08335 [Elusimicrobia bacterium]|nr:hypothetical protein [Elusimicrobiota bacterium]